MKGTERLTVNQSGNQRQQVRLWQSIRAPERAKAFVHIFLRHGSELTHQQEAARTGTNLSTVCQRYKVAAVQNMNHEQYLRAMSAFEKMPTVPSPIPPDQQYNFDIPDGGEEMPFR